MPTAWPKPRQYAGFTPRPVHAQQLSVKVAAGANGSVPGPDAGLVRFVDCILYSADAAAAVMASVVTTLQPSGATIAPAVTGAGSTAFTTPFPLVNGESYRIANGGANPLTALVTYWDEPLHGREVLRTTVDASGYATLIPAAPAGKIGRFCDQRRWNGISSIAVSSTLGIFNDDTIAHTMQCFLGEGATLLGRSSSAGAGAVLVPGGLYLAHNDSSAPLMARLDQAVATRPVQVNGLYEYVSS